MYILCNGEYTTIPPSKDGFSFIITNRGFDPDCPFCHQRLIAHDWNRRFERCLDGTINEYWVEDRMCPRCGKLQRLLPDFLVPHKHYGADAIEKMIDNSSGEILDKYPDTSNTFTIERFKAWWNAMKPYFLAVLISLEQTIGKAYRRADSFKTIVRNVANSCHWTFPTHLVSTPG